MKSKLFGAHFLLVLLIQFAVAEELGTDIELKTDSDHLIRSKRQYGYGNGMWNNGNFPMGGNWNGPNSNGYNGVGHQGSPPTDEIKGSVGTAAEKTPEENQNQNQNSEQSGQGPFWPNNQQGYNNGPFPNGYNAKGPGYNNGQLPYNGGNMNANGNVDDGIKGSIGTVPESTKSPEYPNRSGYRPGYGVNNGYGNPGNQGFGFNRAAGYGSHFGRPILPRGERFVQARRAWRY